MNRSSWVLQLLALWRRHPGMFLGDEEVSTVSTFFLGYEIALLDTGDQTAADAKVLKDLTQYLRDRFGFRENRSWVDIVEELFQTRSDLWPSNERRTESRTDGSIKLLYLLLDDFLVSRDLEWPAPETIVVGKVYPRPLTANS